MPEFWGVAYDTGTNFATGQGERSRTVWSTDQMREEINLIADAHVGFQAAER